MDRYAEAVSICRLLTEAGFPTMLAGGCVRDRLSGLDPKDYDLATAGLPQQIQSFFRKRGMKTIPVGIDHGTISLVTPLQSIEITTLRRDVACFGRKAEVSFSKSFEDDARRRDFTINALFQDHHGEIHDYVGGTRDLQERILRFVGDPSQRIREDYLRILRFFRFLSRLGWPARPDQLAAIKSALQGLDVLSIERIVKEMNQILTSTYTDRVLPILEDCGVFGQLFEWYRVGSVQHMARILAETRTLPPVFAWFTFCFHGGLPHGREKSEAERLKFSRIDKKALVILGNLMAAFDRDEPYQVARILLRIREQSMLDLSELINWLQVVAPKNAGRDQASFRRITAERSARDPAGCPDGDPTRTKGGGRGIGEDLLVFASLSW